MASVYPGSLDSFSTTHVASQTITSAEANNISDAINKIEAELGVDPSGSYSTVALRFASGSLPAGGTAGQVLIKNTSTNGDASWQNSAPLALSGQTPSQAPTTSGIADVGSLSIAARADHVHPSAGLFWMYGTGFDGDLTFDGVSNVVFPDPWAGGNTTLTPVSGVYTVNQALACRNIILGSGAVLAVGQGATIMATGTLSCPTGTATIQANGFAGLANGTAGAARPVLLGPATGSGGAGNTGAGSGGNFAAGGSGQWHAALGGTGGTGTSGAGGTASGGLMQNQAERTWIFRDPYVLIRGVLTGNGTNAGQLLGMLYGGGGAGGGGGDGTNKGGGGGGGAGMLIVNAKYITGNINFWAKGGDGGTPTTGNCGGGAGGGGGYVFVNTTDATGFTGTFTRGACTPGGIPGSGVGTGTTGGFGGQGIAIMTTWK